MRSAAKRSRACGRRKNVVTVLADHRQMPLLMNHCRFCRPPVEVRFNHVLRGIGPRKKAHYEGSLLVLEQQHSQMRIRV